MVTPDKASARGSFTLPGLRGSASPGAGQVAEVGSLESKREPDRVPSDAEVERIYETAEQQRLLKPSGSVLKGRTTVLADVLNCSHVLTDGASAMVDDSFLRCFTSATADPWNWNCYLFPIWLLGLLFRHLVLFPLRLSGLLCAHALFLIAFFTVTGVMKPSKRRSEMERYLVQLMCWAYIMSWSGVIKYHGPRPVRAPNRVWVSNHTSIIDYAILCAFSPCAVVMQLQGGWVGFLQTKVLNSLGCLWFNRTEVKDRSIVARRMREHVANPESTPLHIFPEGTCVNNEYCVMFKRGAFDLGCTVCPVAIKYNKIFVDAFWNSRRQSFTNHLFRLMTSWAVVCDVWFLEPQTKREDETPDEFANRVQKMIADRAGLRVVPWDGYLKYYNLGEKNPGLIEKRRSVFADVLRVYLPRTQQKQDVVSEEPAGEGQDQGGLRSRAQAAAGADKH